MSDHSYVRASNAGCFALGHYLTNGQFTVRRIVWGTLMAKSEKRPGEVIRRAAIYLKPVPKEKRKNPKVYKTKPKPIIQETYVSQIARLYGAA